MNDVPLITVSDVSKTFHTGTASRPVLRGVSLDVAHGEFVCLVGAMGSGKSTLLAIMAGLVPPDGGTVAIGVRPGSDQGQTGVRPRADPGLPPGVSFVFQNYSLLPWFTALENVRLAVAAARPELPRGEQRDRAIRALEQVGLGNAIHRRPRQLSGGMCQRVAIARAFATEPEILFLDEPFGALDALTRETLQGELATLFSHGGRPVTTVMVTNNVEEAIRLADRIVPVLSGPPATLGSPIPVTLSRPRSVATLARDEQASHFRAHVMATLAAATGRRRVNKASTERLRTGALVEVEK